MSDRICIPYAMVDPLIEVSRYNGLTLPKQLTVLLSEREGPMASLSTTVFVVLHIPNNNRIQLKKTEEETKTLVEEEDLRVHPKVP